MTQIGCTDWNHDDGKREAEELEPRVAVGEEIQRRSRLLVARPRTGVANEEEDHDRADALPLDAVKPRTPRGSRRRSGAVRAVESSRAAAVESFDRRLAGAVCPSTYWITPNTMPMPADGEPDVPVDALREIAGDERPEECAEVDPHVEDREPRVAPRVARRVERTDERADVRLQEAGADDDEGEAGVEEGQRLEREREVAERDDDAADEHAAVLAEEPIGDDAAEDRGAPDAAGVGAVDRRGVRIREAQAALRRRRRPCRG